MSLTDCHHTPVYIQLIIPSTVRKEIGVSKCLFETLLIILVVYKPTYIALFRKSGIYSSGGVRFLLVKTERNNKVILLRLFVLERSGITHTCYDTFLMTGHSIPQEKIPNRKKKLEIGEEIPSKKS